MLQVAAPAQVAALDPQVNCPELHDTPSVSHVTPPEQVGAPGRHVYTEPRQVATALLHVAAELHVSALKSQVTVPLHVGAPGRQVR